MFRRCLTCADSQITIASYLKYPESKIRVWKGKNLTAYFTYASNDIDFAKMGVWRFCQILADLDKAGGFHPQPLDDEARRFAEQYLPLSTNGRFELSMLMAIQIKGERTELFNISGPSFVHVPTYDILGAGRPLGKSLAKIMYSKRMQLKAAGTMASMIVGQAKEHVDSVGETSQIVLIYDKNGFADILESDVIEFGERAYSEFQKASWSFLLGYANPQADGDAFKKSLLDHSLRLEQGRRKVERYWKFLQQEKIEGANDALDRDGPPDDEEQDNDEAT